MEGGNIDGAKDGTEKEEYTGFNTHLSEEIGLRTETQATGSLIRVNALLQK
jgi:hypothetical protein